MGADNSILKKKNKNHSDQNKFPKKNSRPKTSETLENKQTPSLIDNFHGEEESFDTRPISKTVKLINSNQKPLEETPNKSTKEKMKSLKSFSTQNLVKIANNHNYEDALADSLETNCCSNKSKEDFNKILNEELYDDIEENNSFDEEDEDNYEEEKENEDIFEDETDEEKKKRELMVTNNIKTVFIYSKVNKENSEMTNEDSRINTLSMTVNDYELNFYRNGNDIRQSYLQKLVSTRVWTPNMKPKQHNSIIIFDWDDTLLPTSFLTPGGVFDENIKISSVDNEKLLKLEQAALKLLTDAIEKGKVYIITNAGKGWVEYSAKKFYPSVLPIL